MKKILGISAFYHDSAAAIVINGNIEAAAQEERFTRKKHTAEFPLQAIQFCLTETGFSLNELDAIVFYEKPLLKFERLLETYYQYAPKGFLSFLKAMPTWLNEKLFLKREIWKYLDSIEKIDRKKVKLLFSEHHLSHAASAYYCSPFADAAILTIDGVGEWATTTIGVAKNEKLEILKELHYPHSIGLLYSSFTYFLGFKVNSGEYKLMGLAPYGNINSDEVHAYIQTIKKEIVTLYSDGSININQKYFKFSTHLKMIDDKKWELLFKFKRREEEETITQQHCNLALAIQTITEEIICNLAQEAKRITNCDNLCMAGGVALNCTANSKILNQNFFKSIYIQPASGDAGGAIGAAIAVNYLYYKNNKNNTSDVMKGSYLGPSYSEKEVILMAKKYKAVYQIFDNFEKVCSFTATHLANGKVVAWFQDKAEFGPRALGNRSILADARMPGMQKKLNLSVKKREGFRPFAPAVLSEDANLYFEIQTESPYMLFTSTIKDNLQINYDTLNMNMWDKLYNIKSTLPAITHVNYSARVQTVDKETNLKFWQLLNEFKTQTACSVLVNTSFNLRGEPPVCSPFDAYNCFMQTDIDYLIIGNIIFDKNEQLQSFKPIVNADIKD